MALTAGGLTCAAYGFAAIASPAPAMALSRPDGALVGFLGEAGFFLPHGEDEEGGGGAILWLLLRRKKGILLGVRRLLAPRLMLPPGLIGPGASAVGGRDEPECTDRCLSGVRAGR